MKEQKFPLLRRAIVKSDTIQLHTKKGKYAFQIFPFGERGILLDPGLMSEIASGLITSMKTFPPFDYIVSPEPGGHTWGVLVAHAVQKPLIILRTTPSGMKGEYEVRRKTGYYKNSLFFPNLERGKKVLIVDDVVSTGGTLITMLNAFKGKKIKVVGVQAILAKTDSYLKIETKYRLKVKTLVQSFQKTST